MSVVLLVIKSPVPPEIKTDKVVLLPNNDSETEADEKELQSTQDEESNVPMIVDPDESE